MKGQEAIAVWGIIAIIFSAPASPLPFHGERVGERGLFPVFLEGDSKLIMKLINHRLEAFLFECRLSSP